MTSDSGNVPTADESAPVNGMRSPINIARLRRANLVERLERAYDERRRAVFPMDKERANDSMCLVMADVAKFNREHPGLAVPPVDINTGKVPPWPEITA